MQGLQDLACCANADGTSRTGVLRCLADLLGRRTDLGVSTQSMPGAIIFSLFGSAIAMRATRLRPPSVRLATADAGVSTKGSRATGVSRWRCCRRSMLGSVHAHA